MRKVSVIGAGMVRFGKYPSISLHELAWPAVKAALGEAELGREAIQAVYCGSVFTGMLTAQRVLKPVGMTGIPMLNLENACSSSSVAFHEAWLAVASGLYDIALVIGVEQLTRLGGGNLPLQADDEEVAQGLTMPALYAMRARRYMHEYGVSEAQLGRVAVKARSHGVANPYAQYQKDVTLEEVLSSKPIADPLTLYQCCPTGDGAAALVLCASARARRHKRQAVRVLASELTSGKYVTGFRDMTVPEITVRAAHNAYQQAGLGPQDIDVAEIHDAFTIAELMYYEGLGFCQPGQAVNLLESGTTSIGGRIPVNPSGGLLSRGHPVGATGAAQIVELVWQLNGACADRQVQGARVGLAHTTGGGVSRLDHGACAIHILGK